MSKIVTVKAVCTATVFETWTFEVPDDYVIPTEMSDALDHLLYGGDDYERPAGVTLVGVKDTETADERDREALDVQGAECIPDDDEDGAE